MKKKILKAGAVAVFCAATLPLCDLVMAAYNPSPIDHSRRDYGAGATRKLGRGLANTGLGWMEVFKGVSDVNAESGFWAGATWGPIYGTMNAVRRTAVGLYETATFPIAGPQKFEPILEPEYVLNEQR